MRIFRNFIMFFMIVAALFSSQLSYKGNIDAHELKDMIKKTGVVIIDIRTKAEWHETGIIKDSKLITFFDEKGDYNLENFMKEFTKGVTDRQKKVVIICRSGSRSVPVADYLARSGYKNVYNQKYGIKEWIKLGFPVVRP